MLGQMKPAGWSHEVHGDRDHPMYQQGCIENGAFCYFNQYAPSVATLKSKDQRSMVCKPEIRHGLTECPEGYQIIKSSIECREACLTKGYDLIGDRVHHVIGDRDGQLMYPEGCYEDGQTSCYFNHFRQFDSSVVPFKALRPKSMVCKPASRRLIAPTKTVMNVPAPLEINIDSSTIRRLAAATL